MSKCYWPLPVKVRGDTGVTFFAMCHDPAHLPKDPPGFARIDANPAGSLKSRNGPVPTLSKKRFSRARADRRGSRLPEKRDSRHMQTKASRENHLLSGLEANLIARRHPRDES